MINELPVPSQMILVSTVQKDKGFRSVVNKMVAQVGAKLGFVPWTIDELPFSDLPTMVLGLDISGSISKKSKQVFSITATSDPNFSQYWSLSEFVQNEQQIGGVIYSALEQAV